MKIVAWVSCIFLLMACSALFLGPKNKVLSYLSFEDSLRNIYFGPTQNWPPPNVEPGISWKELGILPESPIKPIEDSLAPLINLGKILFFDTRLSSSNKISCASCHLPEKHWADARVKSIGHNDLENKRNSPSILNVWFYNKLFWDGRSHSLADQAFSPINSESEMASEMPDLMRKLRRIKAYTPLFETAFKGEGINPETVTMALEVFQKTIVSNKAAFDYFLAGDKNALSDAALRGLHIYRTKANCMNCHNGNLFSDNKFHNNGASFLIENQKDEGSYEFTKEEEDRYKFKTPILRDVVFTAPYFHNGSVASLDTLLQHYNLGMPQAIAKERAIKPLHLSTAEIKDLISFMQSIAATTDSFSIPAMPN